MVAIRRMLSWVAIFCLFCLPALPPSPAEAVGNQQEVIGGYAGVVPLEWGQEVTGVVTRFDPGEGKGLALTFDACGGGVKGCGYDEELIELLRKEGIPATLFINARWIRANPETFASLAADPLFDIANHGLDHRPLSVNGREAYGIKGTESPAEAAREVEDGARAIEAASGKRPLFFRSGTNHYDEVAVRIARELGHRVVGCSVNGDAGATYSAARVAKALMSALPGDIVLMHMNRPEGQTAEGLAAALGSLKEKGFTFVRLYQVLSPPAATTIPARMSAPPATLAAVRLSPKNSRASRVAPMGSPRSATATTLALRYFNVQL